MKWSLVFLLAFHLFSAEARKLQPLKLISASRTPWAGGIAGRHGTNYNLVVSCSAKYKVKLDSIWFKEEGTYGLKQEENHSGFTMQVKTKSNPNNFTYEIIGGSFHDDGMRQHPDDFEKLQDTSNPFRVKGVAVVSYIFKQKKYYLPVSAFTNNPPVNYP